MNFLLPLIHEVGLHLSQLHFKPLYFPFILDFCLKQRSFERLNPKASVCSDGVYPCHEGCFALPKLDLHRGRLLGKLLLKFFFRNPELGHVDLQIAMRKPRLVVLPLCEHALYGLTRIFALLGSTRV